MGQEGNDQYIWLNNEVQDGKKIKHKLKEETTTGYT